MAEEIDFARSLRRNQTDAEQRLWSGLRNRGTGVKFKRQVPIAGYFADFLSREAMLIVELDGSQHADEQFEHDRKRTAVLEAKGFTVMRFWNAEVLADTDTVFASIGAMIDNLTSRSTPHPTSKMSTSPQGEVESAPSHQATLQPLPRERPKSTIWSEEPDAHRQTRGRP